MLLFGIFKLRDRLTFPRFARSSSCSHLRPARRAKLEELWCPTWTPSLRARSGPVCQWRTFSLATWWVFVVGAVLSSWFSLEKRASLAGGSGLWKVCWLGPVAPGASWWFGGPAIRCLFIPLPWERELSTHCLCSMCLCSLKVGNAVVQLPRSHYLAWSFLVRRRLCAEDAAVEVWSSWVRECMFLGERLWECVMHSKTKCAEVFYANQKHTVSGCSTCPPTVRSLAKGYTVWSGSFFSQRSCNTPYRDQYEH